MRLEALKNHTLYTICLVISFMLVFAGAFFYNSYVVSSILMGVGCSGVAASLMSIFLAVRDKRLEQIRIREETRSKKD